MLFLVMLKLQNISFGYTEKLTLQHISFNVEEGESLAIIGESGSGKSTLLKAIYGELDLNEGEILWKSTKILGPAFNLVIGYDFMKYVAQEFDLMPYTTVSENIGKFLSNFYPEEKQNRINELLNVVELASFAKTKVKFLSGGQKQRVALAQALAKQPEIILLDEPFSHIDNFKKQSLRRRVFKYLKENAITCVMATHDKEDVLGYADNMLVLSYGKQIGFDSPENFYNNPESSLIASFFGEYSPLNGEVFYAHQIRIDESSKLKATVVDCYFKGSHYLIEAELNNAKIFLEHSKLIKRGSSISITFSK